ncbi:MAG: cytochrome d ubiquinol oxidase subunit II [Muribaculaceae bacterium]|nr:cytochrome d ubiquinol oxidase subunit II [Muribaculaceae bacterium]
MLTYHLQVYWWFIISLLGAILVFLLFVQGGQSMLLSSRTAMQRTLMVNSLGRKWELSFTTLVVFGGAFFASFPLFYSTSFGGAYWLWMLILFSFTFQAVSYEFRARKGNIYGTRLFDTLLFINGCVGCVLLGVAVGMFFFGGEFSVVRGNILDASSPVISRWASTHGFEAICNWRNLLLGFTVLFLARTQAALFFMNNIADDPFLYRRNRRTLFINGSVFVVLFLIFLAVLLTATGYTTVVSSTGAVTFVPEKYKFAMNYIEMWWCLAALVVGVVAVLYGFLRSVFAAHWTKGIWFSGAGTILVVLSLFWVAGYNDTPYLVSLTDLGSSLTIVNSSSTRYTLEVMSWVSVLVPFVAAYIAYVWYKLGAKPLTPREMESTDHKY